MGMKPFCVCGFCTLFQGFAARNPAVENMLYIMKFRSKVFTEKKTEVSAPGLSRYLFLKMIRQCSDDDIFFPEQPDSQQEG